MATAASQRSIPPEIIVRDGTCPDPEGAAVLVDKPNGPTSHDVVTQIRRHFGGCKTGHAGTLDPLATGLLIILMGRPATRLQDAFMHQGKTYRGTLRLGATTPTYDREMEVDATHPWTHISDADLAAAMESFTGTIVQRPPLYSAVRVQGERLYKKARRGETAVRPPRQVTVSAFELIARSGPDVTFRVDCSKGTYIRSLAHDLGQALDSGAYLTSLRRTHIGAYTVDDAWALDELLRTCSVSIPSPS
ncbi:MAG: tRNA pseudouridine(55) synthase TruB [Longimonas sp.]|uniref:tRNA pseudouridine(55) synthase TruB n=1 Tax=Longimonas sp. TaxID=2039626 RepID=UPI00334C1D11